jgi:hypothetical protein
MDDSSYSLNFDSDKKGEIYHYNLKEHPKIMIFSCVVPEHITPTQGKNMITIDCTA